VNTCVHIEVFQPRAPGPDLTSLFPPPLNSGVGGFILFFVDDDDDDEDVGHVVLTHSC